MENKTINNEVETTKFAPDVYKIKEYLEENCVGKENIKSYSEIMNDLLPDVNKKMYHGRFKKVIQILRTNFDRYICSTSKGYYLPTCDEEYSSYNLSQTITHLKTCIAQGVDKRIFYDLLNNTPSNNVLDGQQKLKISPYAKTEVTRNTKPIN